ncbi:(Fe-S)-binding protein [Metabacillus rhizolycopersici]|uniref:(Fe-S)-binding protein n=1 Tax=Metabacillus rhizolycopersici TaxID=2875709 RepID=A0ABS7UXI8_9BACI|nr:(Fe-S)-binding protein [Metabacillus rhizolycopersici]MBZ5752959.1 (Fe-S)-binding protein [Metabacillus rhizolycopersici]
MLAFLNFIAFLAVTGYGIYTFANLVYSRVTFIKLGKKSDLRKDTQQRITEVLINVFGQRKLFKDKKSGFMHLILFYTFFIIQVGLIELIIKGFIKGYEFPFGEGHKYFSLLQEWATFLMLMAVVYGFYRRYGEKLKRLQWKRDGKAAFVYIALSTLTSSILLTLGFEAIMLDHEPNLAYAPFSGAIALLFSGIGTTAGTILFYIFWWVHMVTVFSFMVFVPQSKQAHELFAMFNVFFKKVGPVGKLRKIDFEDEEIEEYGVGKIEDFTQLQLIDLYACAECGRCTNMCPASGTGKTLSPMDLIIKMRDHLTEKGAAVTSRNPWMPSYVFGSSALSPTLTAESSAQETAATVEMPNLIGDVITEEEIWACTTCRNCEDQCPVANEHVDKIIDLRRYLVLTEGNMPHEATRYFQNIERQSNPWGMNRKERIKWREGREDIVVPTVDEIEDFEYLFFVGSMGSFDNRSQKIAQSFAKIMNVAGVKFAILGNEERSSGDTARRMGNEFLFQQLCQENIANFQAYGVKKIVTICPHTYNTFKHEYPEFGLEAEVYHHTELIFKLIQEGSIKPTKEVQEAIAYHDSCYIGRYNDIYDIPRQILKSIPGVQVLEMERNKADAMCCGAGGGNMWMEETEGKRVNIERTEQALRLNPTTIGSNCPYCLTMMSDGTKAKEAEERVKTMDITEIVEKSLVC